MTHGSIKELRALLELAREFDCTEIAGFGFTASLGKPLGTEDTAEKEIPNGEEVIQNYPSSLFPNGHPTFSGEQ